MTQVDQVGFSCAACGKQYRWKPELAGKSVKCKCGSPIKVPREAGGVAALAAAPVSAKPQASARASADVPPPRAPKAVKPKPVEDDGDGGGDLDALMALAQQEAATAEEAASQADTHFCANCRSRMSPEAVICVNCGFDRRKGNVIATAKVKDPNARRLFGLLPPPSEKAKKKQVDMMAPQGSFMIGMAASVGLGLVGAVLSFVVALLIKRDLFFLIPLVGIGAGVGMQIGQRGYSTMGGLFAAIVTLVLIIPTRLVILLLVILPADIARAAEQDGERAEELRQAQPTRTEIQPFDPSNVFKEREFNDRDNNAPIGENEDPRVVAMIAEQVYKDFHINPEFASGDQHNAVDLEAHIRATTMPAEKKKQYIAEMDKKAEHARMVSMLTDEGIDRLLEANPEANYRSVRLQVEQMVQEKVRKMTPEDEQKEMARLKEVQKVQMAKAQTRMAEMQKEARKEAAAAAVAAAVADGFDAADAPADAGDEAAMNGDADGQTEADGFDDEEEGGAPDKKAAAVAATQGARPTAAAPAAKSGGGIASSSDADDADDADAEGAVDGEEEETSGAGLLGVGLLALLFMIFYGGIFKFLFMLSSIFLAYRTAAGATWG